MNIQHGKRIITESYYDGTLSATKHEYEVSIFCTPSTVLRDVIEAMATITSGSTHKLSLEICIDKQGRYRLVKKWVSKDI